MRGKARRFALRARDNLLATCLYGDLHETNGCKAWIAEGMHTRFVPSDLLFGKKLESRHVKSEEMFVGIRIQMRKSTFGILTNGGAAPQVCAHGCAS